MNFSSLQSTHEIMSTLMVPTKDIKEYTELLEDNKVDILGQESFIDLRETGSGGANQTTCSGKQRSNRRHYIRIQENYCFIAL